MCAWTYYLWRTCERFGQELWCRIDYSSGLSELATGTFLEMVAWGSVAPLTVLVLGVVTYQVIKHFCNSSLSPAGSSLAPCSPKTAPTGPGAKTCTASNPT